MTDALGRFLAGPIGSFLRVFGTVVLTAFLIDLTDSGRINFGEWQAWLVAGLVSALPVIIAALNPSDDRFGLTDTPPPGDGR